VVTAAGADSRSARASAEAAVRSNAHRLERDQRWARRALAARIALSSVYALTKYDQERLCLLFGEAYQVPTVALRFFNVYGSATT